MFSLCSPLGIGLSLEMAKPFQSELAKLADTLAWARQVEIDRLRAAVRTAGLGPLIAVGSGGSLSGAHALASIHRRAAQRVAAVSTPLELANAPIDLAASIWLLSAGGSNVDILAAASMAIHSEPRQVAVLSGKETSPLADLCRDHAYVDFLPFNMPAGRDGFLATNSLFAFCCLLARTYAEEFDQDSAWREAAEHVEAACSIDSALVEQWQTACAPLWERETTVVLHGVNASLGAIDLESKFTEAALGNLHVSDYRNFAHGRHHWLAKRGHQSAVLALVSDNDEPLAGRTLALIPDYIPVARVSLPGGPTAVMLTSLLAAFWISGWAGQARDIDPGRPGVPEFGRKIYHLPLPARRGAAHATTRDEAAITRKAGTPLSRLTQQERDLWQRALAAFRARLKSSDFAGIVFDYDGTLVDTRDRYHPPFDPLRHQLVRLLEGGVRVAMATGRGVSVRRDLRSAVPEVLWPSVLVGYYNGAEIAALDDDSAPDGTAAPTEELRQLAERLRADPELAELATQTDRKWQITLQAKRPIPENRLWDIAQQITLIVGDNSFVVTRSSHSIDIVPASKSKADVLVRLAAITGNGALLTIGDRGRWPGNDYALLRSPFALSVDEVSVDPETCWNLGNPGQRGISATLDYLSNLQVVGRRAQFGADALI